MKIAQLLPLIVLPAMGNTGVCPIAVNPTERGICTILTTKWVQTISGVFDSLTPYIMTASNTVDLEFSIFICNLQLISTIIGVRL